MIVKPRRVQVYFNVRRKKLSVRERKKGENWLVTGHHPGVVLRNVEFKVYRAAYERALREGRKNVHAFCEGDLVGHFFARDNPELFLHDGTHVVKIYYGVYTTGGNFVDADCQPVKGAELVVIKGREILAQNVTYFD